MLEFGIQLMQAGLLIEQARTAMNRPGGIGVRGLSVDAAALAGHLTQAGFNLIEVNPDLAVFFPNCFDLPAVERLRALKQSQGLRYTVHLPLWSVEPSSPVPAVRQGAVDTLVDAVLRLAPLEPQVYVLHATGSLAAEFFVMPVLGTARPLVMAMFNDQARRSVEALLERTGLSPRQVAVETIQFPFDLTLSLAEEMDLSICLDTGHVLAGFSGPVTLEEALERTLLRLAEVHLHDAYRRPRADGSVQVADHLPLGQGDLPLEWFLGALEGGGFAGPVIFELSIEEARASLEAVGTVRSRESGN